jgi:CheY-like chemotaxis protein
VRVAGAPAREDPRRRLALEPGDSVLLVVEDDPTYARIMMDQAREKGFKVLVASRGAEALALAREYRPTAVSLDVFLPDMLGWTVLSQLKQDPALRHIPVQIVTMDEDRQHGLSRGAFSFLPKPTTTKGLESALIRIKNYAKPTVTPPSRHRGQQGRADSIAELLGHSDIEIDMVGTGKDALKRCASAPNDCAVLDLRLPDMSGFEVARARPRRQKARRRSVVVFTGKELTPEEDMKLHTLARSVVVKGVESPERLARRDVAVPPPGPLRSSPREAEDARTGLTPIRRRLVGKTVLVVDDRRAQHLRAQQRSRAPRHGSLDRRTGTKRFALLADRANVAIVLMDIMMPEMDGYQTMNAIRQKPTLRRLPIIALTASHEGRSREMLGRRSLGLPGETGQHGAAPLGPADVAPTLGAAPSMIGKERVKHPVG